MKFLVEHLENLRHLYVNQLQMLSSAEQQIAIGMQKMIERSTDPELTREFTRHKEETETHVERLKQILLSDTGDADLVKCKAAQALVAETDDMYMDARKDPVRDVALIAGAQRIEHFEIAAYRSVIRFAQLLGETGAEELLQKTVDEEEAADINLGEIAGRLEVLANQA